MKILLVDDSKSLRSIERGMLEQLGYTQFEEAADGLDALSKVGAFQPDLILLDWNMPRMNGIDFLKSFRQTNKATPVIMVTTEAEKEQVVEAIKAGVTNYLVKPFTREQLSQRIVQTISKKAAA
jgi:two-component system chemotaxis response regulator CheY